MENKIIFIVIISIVILLIFVKFTPNIKDNEINETEKENEIEKFSFFKENLIPNINYTCEDLIPKRMDLILNPKTEYPFEIVTPLKNDKIVGHPVCLYNNEVGQSATGFTCQGDYRVVGEVSEGGIILRDYFVKFSIYFDEKSCGSSFKKEIEGSNYLFKECEVLDYTCSWEYYKRQSA